MGFKCWKWVCSTSRPLFAILIQLIDLPGGMVGSLMSSGMAGAESALEKQEYRENDS